MDLKLEKKLVFIFLVLLGFFVGLGIYFLDFQGITGYSIYSQGNGSIENPYVITNCTQLQEMRQNLSAHYVLGNDINMSAPGCEEFQEEEGFQPVGNNLDGFVGSLDGQDHTIYNLFINRSSENYVGLFGQISQGNISNLSLYEVLIYGKDGVGSLAGSSVFSNISKINSKGYVNGVEMIGGLLGQISMGSVENSSFDGIVKSKGKGTYAGGLTGAIVFSFINNSKVNATIESNNSAGGIAGISMLGGIITSSFQGNITSNQLIGGLVAYPFFSGFVNSFYNYNSSYLNNENIITIGALYQEHFNEWLDNNRSLNISKYLTKQEEYYFINNIFDFKQLLAFGQEDSLKFKLNNSLDLINDTNFYVPYFSGEFDGQGNTISNLNVYLKNTAGVGLFSYHPGNSYNFSLTNISLNGSMGVGGLTGLNMGNLTDISVYGNVEGTESVGGGIGYNLGKANYLNISCNVFGEVNVGGIVGYIEQESGLVGSLSNSFFQGNLTGQSHINFLVSNFGHGTKINNSFYNYNKSYLNGEEVLSIGALYEEQFDDWISNGKILSAENYFIKEDDYYFINNNSDLKNILGFAYKSSIKFKLNNSLDLINETNFYIPYFSGEFDGQGNAISNLNVNHNFLNYIGLFGFSKGDIFHLGLNNVNVSGKDSVGGLVGRSEGNLRDIYVFGIIDGEGSYSSGGISGRISGNINRTYSVSNKPLVGSYSSSIFNSYYDSNLSGFNVYTGGTPKTTEQMKISTTYEGWDFENIWGINETYTYPYLGNPGKIGEIPEDSSENGGTTPGGTISDSDSISTFRPTETQLGQGYTRILRKGDRIRFLLNGTEHFVILKNFTQLTITYEVASDPIKKTIELGDKWKVNVNSDEYYDLIIEPKSITVNTSVTTYVKKIRELIEIEETDGEDSDSESSEGEFTQLTPANENEEGRNNFLLIVILISVFFLIIYIIILFFYFYKKSIEKKNKIANKKESHLNKKNSLDKNSINKNSLNNEEQEKIKILNEINISLNKSLDYINKSDKYNAITTYNEAKKLFQDNKLEDPKIIEKFYEIALKIEGFE